jgi:hypothetical protein
MLEGNVVQQRTLADEVPPDAGVIEVRVRELSQLFDSMDPSPFHERDLDREAEEYIVGSARELPTRGPLTLVVYLDKPAGLQDEGRILREAVREHFGRKADFSRRELRQLLRRGWISLAIGLSFLAAALVGGASVVRWMGESPLATVLRESLLIGGWVAMWRPLEIFLYDWWVIRGERRLYDRLGQMPVRIVYTGSRLVRRRPWRPAARGGAPDERQAYTIRLFDEATGREVGRISEAELAFLQDALEEEGLDDHDYWINPDTVDMLERRGAPAHLISLLRAAVGDDPDGMDVAFEREGEARQSLRERRRRDGSPSQPPA